MYAFPTLVTLFFATTCFADHLQNECKAYCNLVPYRTDSMCEQDCKDNGCLMKCMRTGRKFGPCQMNCGLDEIAVPQMKEGTKNWFEQDHDNLYQSICLAGNVNQCVCILDCVDNIPETAPGEVVANQQVMCRNGCGVFAVAG